MLSWPDQSRRSPDAHDPQLASVRRRLDGGPWPPQLVAEEVPWKERHEFFPTTLAPTSGERLASAVGLAVSDCALSPGPGSDYTLTVMPRDTVVGVGVDPPVCSNEADQLLCPDDLFYGQPTPGGACTAFLVDTNKVLIAGHCSPGVGLSCTHRYVVFDWALLDPNNPPPSSGSIVIPNSRVTRCLQVLADEGPETQGELPTVPESDDWAL